MGYLSMTFFKNDQACRVTRFRKYDHFTPHLSPHKGAHLSIYYRIPELLKV